ncbi:AraC family transcriptional regulator [Paenibacillus chartarius]|uniref:AraC family transcriptional regulator n=1 Tax=Paenibacillus chartarius TaxID=747481 RepID=A0ABV6DJ82_9BACL
MPSLLEPAYMGSRNFFMSYRSETKNENWLMLHAHQGIELLYVHQGAGTVTLERKQYRLQPGTLFCFQPYQLHKVEVPPLADASYIRTNVTFDPRVIEAYLAPFPKLQSFVRLLAKGTLTEQVFTFAAGDHRFEELLGGYDKARSSVRDEHQEEERALFLLTLLRHLQMEVFPEQALGFPNAEKASGHVERILDWIESRFRLPFELGAMAEELHLSPYHLSHLFKRHTGVTLSDYIAGRRVREACALLANTDKSVGEIAREVGGFSAPYFCQMFKKHKGVTPQSYRAAIRQAYR